MLETKDMKNKFAALEKIVNACIDERARAIQELEKEREELETKRAAAADQRQEAVNASDVAGYARARGEVEFCEEMLERNRQQLETVGSDRSIAKEKRDDIVLAVMGQGMDIKGIAALRIADMMQKIESVITALRGEIDVRNALLIQVHNNLYREKLQGPEGEVDGAPVRISIDQELLFWEKLQELHRQYKGGTLLR